MRDKNGVWAHMAQCLSVGFLHAAEFAAPSLGVKVIALGVHTVAEIERAVTEFAADSNGGLIVAPHAVTVGNRDVIIRLAVRYRLPAIYGPRHYATSGGLISYGPNPIDPFRQGASYVDRILNRSGSTSWRPPSSARSLPS